MSISEKIVEAAKGYIGTPYKTLDCNELVRSTFRDLGVDLGDPSSGNAKDLYNKGLAVEVEKAATKADIIAMLNVGDLVFWGNPKYPTRWREIHHVAIYIGDGKIIESTGDPGVHIGSLWESSGVKGWQIVLIGYPVKLIEQEDEEMLTARDSGPAMKVVQLALINAGHQHNMNTAALGKGGPNTEEALRAFKVERGLPDNGDIDTDTWAALLDEGNEATAEAVAQQLKIGALNRQVESLQGHLRQFLKLADGIKL